MAQIKRKQPMRACRDLAPPIYCEGGSGSRNEKTKTVLVETKRRVNQSRLRPVVPSPEPATEVPVQTIWSELHPDLVECILGHLPVSTLRSTVMAINPIRWRQIFLSNKVGILRHGNHVDSSIGCIKTYFIEHRQWDSTATRHDNVCPPPPQALEHTTSTWQALPKYPEANVRHLLKVQSVSEGLILMVMPDTHGCQPYSPATPGLSFRHRLVTWNPVSQSRRWLPLSPLKYHKPDCYYCMELLVVNPDKTGYKVVEFFESVRAYPAIVPGWERRRVRIPHYYHQQTLNQKEISGYTVYDSSSAAWGAVQPPPRNISELRLNHAKSFVSCDEGSVCFVNVELQITGWEMPVGIVCWNSSTNVWSEALFPDNFFKLPGLPPGCHVEELLYANGKVYMIFERPPRKALCSQFIVAISLSDIQSGIGCFQYVGRVRELAAPKSIAQGSGTPQNHPPPTRNEVKLDELKLHRPMCSRWCIHRWYMLPVGRSFHLCVVMCGKWLWRFDLDACVWIESVTEIPSEYDVISMRTALPSGAVYNWDINYHPYIPSWVKV